MFFTKDYYTKNKHLQSLDSLSLLVLLNILGVIANWGTTSEMVGVKLPDIIYESMVYKNILSDWNGYLL